MPQRVNTRFLIILTIVVAAFVALGLAAKFLLHRNPKNFVAAGDAAAHSGNWPLAAANYNRAISLGRADPDLYIRDGVALEHCVGADPDCLKQAEAAYQNALVVDPSNASAARDLLEMSIQMTEVEPGAAVFEKLRDNAQKVAQLDPSDQRAVAYQHVAAILLSERESAPAGDLLADDFDALAKIIRQGTSDSNLPFYYARGKLRLASLAIKNQNPDAAARLAREAAAMFDEALDLKGDEAAMNWRASTLYAALPRFDPAAAAAYQAKADATIARAKSLANPSDARYADIQIAAALAAVAHHRLDDAEAILRDLFALQPKNPFAQLQLGGFLGRIRGKRDEAIAVLSTPMNGDGEVGAPALRTHGQQQQRLYELARLQIDAYAALTDPAAEKQLLSKIEANYQALADLVGQHDSDPLLHLKAEIQQLKGDDIGAMATYRLALGVMEHADAPDIDLMYRAGLLDLKEGQSGEAEKLFARVVEADPGFVPPQLALADQYLNENSPEKAQKYIDSAAKLDPDSATIIQLRIRQLLEQRQTDAARAAYATLPEADSAQQLAKAKYALLVANPADASRLLEPLYKQSPDDLTIADALVQADIANGQRDQARAVVEQGLRKNPKNISLLILRQQLDSPSGNQVAALDPQLLAATDDFTRELLEYEKELNHNNYDAAAAHLAAADRLRPDSASARALFSVGYRARALRSGGAGSRPARGDAGRRCGRTGLSRSPRARQGRPSRGTADRPRSGHTQAGVCRELRIAGNRARCGWQPG